MPRKQGSVETYDKILRAQAARLRQDVRRRASGETGPLTHIPTGFETIDGRFGGVRIGVVTELMAHTGDGKSAFMRQLAEGAARAGVGVLWVVAEDPTDATAERQFSGDTGIGSDQLGRLDLSPEELDRVGLAADAASKWASRVLPVFEGQDVDSVLSLVDETDTIGGAPLGEVLIDYAQVLGSSRTLEDDIARLGAGLHQRSRARKFATMVGSQVSTDVIKRGRDGWLQYKDISRVTPGIGDTEWCKRLEKLTKAVWSLVRPGRWQREFGAEADDDYAEWHVKKANFGPMGWERLGWDGNTCKFFDVK